MFRLIVAGGAPLLVASVALAFQPTAVLALAGGVAAGIAVFTSLFTHARHLDTAALLKRLLAAMVVRLGLTGAALLVLTRLAPAEALAIALVLAGGVAAAVLCEALLLIPSRVPARA